MKTSLTPSRTPRGTLTFPVGSAAPWVSSAGAGDSARMPGRCPSGDAIEQTNRGRATAMHPARICRVAPSFWEAGLVATTSRTEMTPAVRTEHYQPRAAPGQ